MKERVADAEDECSRWKLNRSEGSRETVVVGGRRRRKGREARGKRELDG